MTVSTNSQLIKLPDPRLHQASAKVQPNHPQIKQLIKTMTHEALNWEQSRPDEISVGLAAIQIGQPLKVILIREDFAMESESKFITLINPKIKQFIGKIETEIEGCLSVDGYYAKVARYQGVKVEALNPSGQIIKFKAFGFLARVLQHEVDHLSGLTIIDKTLQLNQACLYTLDNAKFKPTSINAISKLGFKI